MQKCTCIFVYLYQYAYDMNNCRNHDAVAQRIKFTTSRTTTLLLTPPFICELLCTAVVSMRAKPSARRRSIGTPRENSKFVTMKKHSAFCDVKEPELRLQQKLTFAAPQRAPPPEPQLRIGMFAHAGRDARNTNPKSSTQTTMKEIQV